MIISNTTLIVIIGTTIFITYMICSYTQNCNIDCKINYNKIENYKNKEKPINNNITEPTIPTKFINLNKKKNQLKIHL